MEYSLLEKREIWIEPIQLSKVDLGACARAVAKVFGLRPDEVMVTDVLENTMTLDVLASTVQAEKIIGRSKDLLASISSIPGVHITNKTQVYSNGVLGFVALNKEIGEEIIDSSRDMAAQIEERIRRRCLIFASGKEIISAQIRDTNSPFLINTLRSEGYDVSQGPTLDDSAEAIAKVFTDSAANGYGLLITTGGIGAERKDQTLEALASVDPNAIMPCILKFQKGQGRHHKDAVRIGIGTLDKTLIVSLPGPHDEVQLTWPVLKEGLKNDWTKEELAEALAVTLRTKFSGYSYR